MLKRLLLAALLFAALAYGVTQLFLLRFATGEVYPEYCSLRADPLGTKALHDSLRALPHLEVQRNFRPIRKLQPTTPITLLYAGTPYSAWWQDDELRHVEALAVTGARIVFTFVPVQRAPSDVEARRFAQAEKERKEKRLEKLTGKKKEEPKDEKAADKKESEEAMPATFFSFHEVAERWGFQFRFLPPEKAPRQAKATLPGANTEPELSWHTALHFGTLKDKWRTLYTVADQPVVIERSFGAGSIVLASDSYALSNEALRHERAPGLLAALVGSAKTIVFDEESHGVKEEPGIAALAQKYGLHGVAAGFVLIAALFIWQSATRLVPPLEDEFGDGALIRGREASEGLINLLRRSISPAEILAVCAAEWRKSATPSAADQTRVEELLAQEQARPARQRNPIETYQAIAKTLSRH